MKRNPREQGPVWVMRFCSSCSRAVCQGCTCLQPLPPAVASAELGSRAAPGKTSKVNSRAGNIPLLSEGGQDCLLLCHGQTGHFQSPSLLPAQLGRWGAGTEKVPTALRLVPVSRDGIAMQKLMCFFISSRTTHQQSLCNSMVLISSRRDEMFYFKPHPWRFEVIAQSQLANSIPVKVRLPSCQAVT